MTSPVSLKNWAGIHKWTSLICTLFLLMLCVTGLPLIFRDEIEDWLDDGPAYQEAAADAPRVSLDAIVAEGRKRYPDEIPTSLFIDDDEPKIVLYMAPSWQSFLKQPSSRHWLKFDAHGGRLLGESGPGAADASFINVLFRLHRDLFTDLPGELFLGLMGLLFIVAIVSGIVLYAPFARKIRFGEIRTRRSPRLKWIDLHNLTGVVTLAWALMVGATGVLNELTTPLFGLWQQTDVRALLAAQHGTPIQPGELLSSVQAAWETARAARADSTVTGIVFPGSPAGSPYHYVGWTRGTAPLTHRLFNPVLIDARTGQFGGAVSMPWYLRALEISRPLHFGDYGGMPLKIIWSLLDLLTIFVLASGLYLWLKRETPEDVRETLDGRAVE